MRLFLIIPMVKEEIPEFKILVSFEVLFKTRAGRE